MTWLLTSRFWYEVEQDGVQVQMVQFDCRPEGIADYPTCHVDWPLQSIPRDLAVRLLHKEELRCRWTVDKRGDTTSWLH